MLVRLLLLVRLLPTTTKLSFLSPPSSRSPTRRCKQLNFRLHKRLFRCSCSVINILGELRTMFPKGDSTAEDGWSPAPRPPRPPLPMPNNSGLPLPKARITTITPSTVFSVASTNSHRILGFFSNIDGLAYIMTRLPKKSDVSPPRDAQLHVGYRSLGGPLVVEFWGLLTLYRILSDDLSPISSLQPCRDTT
ncbi:hypothetical protein A9K55_002189 [Cordyceps militaris]|uniref:Uncharacterized protein n=1 Tax=Cordyceps militaris TaxID=73501 RepID=A0A2H4SSG6_CORMI|nr:hypothetical protein A9K55_002189 [Cordyceps militaris]